jgi:hypothetical protein
MTGTSGPKNSWAIRSGRPDHAAGHAVYRIIWRPNGSKPAGFVPPLGGGEIGKTRRIVAHRAVPAEKQSQTRRAIEARSAFRGRRKSLFREIYWLHSLQLPLLPAIRKQVGAGGGGGGVGAGSVTSGICIHTSAGNRLSLPAES